MEQEAKVGVDLAAFAMAHLNLLPERGKLNFMIWDSGSASLFFSERVNFFVGSLAFDAFCRPPRYVPMASKTNAPNIAC